MKTKNFFLTLFFIVSGAVISYSCDKSYLGSERKIEDIILDKSGIVVFDSDSLKVTEFGVFEDWHNMQGGAIYGDKLVCLMATDEMKEGTEYNGFIYDLNTGKKESDLLFDSVLNGRYFSKPHANQISFGKHFYDNESYFPLLYVSQVNGGTGKNDISGERGVLVYNLAYKNGEYSPVLVQAIIPDLSDTKLLKAIGQYTPNYIVDTLNDQILVMGYPNQSWFDLRGPQPLALFNIPSLNDGEVILLSYSDLIEVFQLDRSFGIQQSVIFNRKVYSTGGVKNKGTLRVIDLEKKRQERLYNLSVFSGGEPQFIGVWRNRFLYYEAGTSGVLYEFLFNNCQ